MTTEFQSFAGTVQGNITAPAGWTIVNGALKRWTAYGAGEIHGNVFGQMTFNTYSAGLKTISAPMRWNSVGASSVWGFCFINAALTGFSLQVKNGSTTLKKEVTGTSGAVIDTLTTVNTTDATFSLVFDDATGSITVKKDGTTVLTGVYTDTPNLKAGIQSYNSGTAQSYASVTLDYTPAQTVTSINGGSPFAASQTSSSAVTTGFTGLPATITSNLSGLTFGSVGGTTNAPTFSKSVRVDGQQYPKNGTTATVTFTNGAETASGTITCNKDAAETAVIAASPINDDITCLFGAIFAATARSAANGDEVYHTVPAGMSDLVILPNGEMSVTNAGTFTCWVYTNATGVNYYYDVTITESGGVTVSSSRILAARGIKPLGIVARGLVARGL